MSEDSELDLDQQKQLIKELRQRMKDDGEYICTLSERCERYRNALLKHKEENQHLTDKIHQLYAGAEEQKQRIKRLEEDLGDAYAEMRKQHHTITAVYDRSVWTKAKEAKP